MRREGRVGGGSETHAEAKAGDEGEGAAAPDGEHRDVEGPVFGADLCDIFRTGHVSCIACEVNGGTVSAGSSVGQCSFDDPAGPERCP